MRSFSNLIVILIIMAFSVAVLAGENEELFGAWVNMDYKDENHTQMIIFKLGEYGHYSSANDDEPMWTGEYQISANFLKLTIILT